MAQGALEKHGTADATPRPRAHFDRADSGAHEPLENFCTWLRTH